MSLEFYLFDVGQGQAAAIRLPNDRWCLFDAGRNTEFSPVDWIVKREHARYQHSFRSVFRSFSFSFLRCTISHLHGDHLGDYESVSRNCPDYLRTVVFDKGYLDDALESSAVGTKPMVSGFCLWALSSFGEPDSAPDCGAVSIKELALPVMTARLLGGGANNRVNNASVITRIDYCDVSILLCGDVERDAWELVLNSRHLAKQWRPLVADVNILVAPHHGHTSGYSTSLMSYAAPDLVLVSVASKDPSVDSRYSQVPGAVVSGQARKCVTTRSAPGHIRVVVKEPLLIGAGTWKCDTVT